MARFRPADAPTRKRDQLANRSRDNPAVKTGELGADPWVAVDGPESSRETTSKSPSAVPATVPKDKLEDDIALPTPIAATVPLGKIVTADGRELPYYHEIPGFVYQPLPGFEHCFKPRELTQGTPSSQRSPKTPQASARPQETQQPASQQKAAYTGSVNESNGAQANGSRNLNAVFGRPTGPKQPRRKTLKRSRSVARSLREYPPPEYSSEYDDDEEDDDRHAKVATEQSYSFYIGDLKELKKFFRRRFDELTTRPLRTIVTAWIKQLEPRRLGGYGPYHKLLPSEQPPECTPPWWPEDVPYNEPSHLSKGHLQTLAINIMLQHQKIDEVKRRGSWVAKLRQAAQCAVEMTTSELFSSSKRAEFSEKMKERALGFILPSLFDVAESYEDHIAQYDLYDGAGNTDPGQGRYVTWHAASKPPRQVLQRKRARRSRRSQVPRIDRQGDTSVDETEVDDTISNSFLRRQSRKHTRASRESNNGVASRQQAPAAQSPAATAVPPTPAAPKQEFHHDSSRPAPNTSFNQSMDDLQLSEGISMDMDVKGGDAAQYHDQTLLRNMFSLSQPMQYSSSHPGYVFQPQGNASSFSNSAQSSFASGSTTGFPNPYPMFNAPYSPQVGTAAFGASMASNNGGYPYEYQGSFPAAPMAAHANASFNSFHNDFNIGDQGRHH